VQSKIKHIWDEFNQELLNYIDKRVGNRFDAEDILQETYLKIYKSIEQIEDETKLKSWIYKITRNTIIDYYRTRRESSIDIDQLMIAIPEDDSEINMNDEIASCLGQIMFDLSARDKEIIELHNLNGMKHKEISDKLDISLSSSKMRLKRAKVKLKDILVECCDFETDKYGNIIDFRHKQGKCENCECSKIEK